MDYLGLDGKPVRGDLIGEGVSGSVLRISKDTVLKVPKLLKPEESQSFSRSTCDHLNIASRISLQSEIDAYRLIGPMEGIIPTKVVNSGIELPYKKNGTVQDYLYKNKDVELPLRFQWICAAVKAIRSVHSKRVLINDISLQNFLLEPDLSITLVDFGNSIIVSDDADFGRYVYYANSCKSDVAQVGSLIYELVTGTSYVVYVNEDAPFDKPETSLKHNGVAMWFPYWPLDEELEPTKDIFLGDIIRKSWLKNGYQTVDKVWDAISKVAVEFPLEN